MGCTRSRESCSSGLPLLPVSFPEAGYDRNAYERASIGRGSIAEHARSIMESVSSSADRIDRQGRVNQDQTCRRVGVRPFRWFNQQS